jgi:pimeloyl-ACP methyl ester carboxylesterase
MNTIAVLLPGIAGSSLAGTGPAPYFTTGLVWPLDVLAVSLVNQQTAAEMLKGVYPGESALTPGEPLGWTRVFPEIELAYGSFRNFFEGLGFTPVAASAASMDIPSPAPEKLVVGFAYDWRQDNTTSAANLRALLGAIDTAYAGTDYQVHLIGHSMGGLVSRAYLEHPPYQQDAWYPKIVGLITLGTPHLGAPLAVEAITGTLPAPLSLYNPLVQSFVNGDNMVSTYQLLPPPQIPFIEVGGPSYSIFAADLPAEVSALLASSGLNETSKQSAAAFFAGLDYAGESVKIPYYCLYGGSDLIPTCEGFTFDGSMLQANTDHAGDGVVPSTSASFAGRQVPVTPFEVEGVNHLLLPSNMTVLQQVAQWMGVEIPVVHFTGIDVPAGASA